MQDRGCVNIKFIVFLKATLGKMVATKTLGNDFINLEFWQNWPHKFYNVKSYDSTKDDFEKDNAEMDRNMFDSLDEDEDDGEECYSERQTQLHWNDQHHKQRPGQQQQAQSHEDEEEEEEEQEEVHLSQSILSENVSHF